MIGTCIFQATSSVRRRVDEHGGASTDGRRLRMGGWLVTDSDDRHVTRRELQLELRALAASLTWRQGVLTAGAVGLLKFDVPDPITAGALGAAGLALAYKLVLAWFHHPF